MSVNCLPLPLDPLLDPSSKKLRSDVLEDRNSVPLSDAGFVE